MKVAWLFPGQGAQEVGMGKAIADASPAARGVYEAADRALGEPISRVCFEGPLETLTLTENTQPALVATSCAIVAALRDAMPDIGAPAFAAGHSLGEYSALVAAGALTLEDAVRLCRIRGSAMQEAVPPGKGAMAAVMGVAEADLVAICEQAAREAEGVVSPANYNAHGQIVIAGDARAVARAGELCAARRSKVIPLKVSAPFHCALMRPAAERVARELERIPMGELAFPVVANVDGEPNRDKMRVADLLVRQIDGPVQWVKCVERMAAAGVTHALEIGPGKVLANLVKRIAPQIAVTGVGDPAGVEKAKRVVSGGA